MDAPAPYPLLQKHFIISPLNFVSFLMMLLYCSFRLSFYRITDRIYDSQNEFYSILSLLFKHPTTVFITIIISLSSSNGCISSSPNFLNNYARASKAVALISCHFFFFTKSLFRIPSFVFCWSSWINSGVFKPKVYSS